MHAKDYYSHVERTLKKTLVILIVALVAVFFDRQNIFLWGLVAGLVVGAVNTFFLGLRIDKMVKVVLNHGEAAGGAFVMMGFFSRWGLIMLACLFAVKTGWFSLIGMLAGFLAPSVLSVGEGIRDLRAVSDKKV
ncbi:MAG: ATP synthase subunit I [Bacillota bacterium]